MIPLSIIIKTIDDLDPAFPQVTPENYAGECTLESVSILEHGMASGKTSIGLLIKLSDGSYTVAQASAALLDMIWHTLQGAEQRFADIKANKQ